MRDVATIICGHIGIDARISHFSWVSYGGRLDKTGTYADTAQEARLWATQEW
jgi:hypothetical protein